MLLKWQEAKLPANPGRRLWILRRCCGSSVTEAAVVGMRHCSSGTILGQHQWVMSRAWEHRACAWGWWWLQRGV